MKLKVKMRKETLLGIGMTAGVFFGGLLLIGLIMNFIIMPLAVRHGDETQVPDVLDLSLQAADIRLKESDLEMVKGTEEYHPSKQRGAVIGQYPTAGSLVKRGRKVILTLSKGSASATVPVLEGFLLSDARLLLEKQGLQAGDIIWYEDTTRADGVVITSLPQAGTVMKLNARVQLIVNRLETENLVSMPNFVGHDLEHARKVAEDNYLKIGEFEFKIIENLLPETVIGQSVPAGTIVQKWSTVNLIITSTD